MASATLPLSGIRVLEFCWVWSGPFLGQFLADLGAEVIKVEWYDRFDLYRTRGVERLRGRVTEEHRREMSPAFHSVNRNKVGCALNLKKPEGLEIAKALAGKSDVVINNFTSGTMESLGLGAETLHELKPELVVVSLAGFGSGSRLDSMRAYGSILSSLSGIESEIVDEDDTFVGSPTFVVSDPNAALFGLLRVTLGIAAMRQDGLGTASVVSQLEGAMALFGGMVEPEEDGIVDHITETAEPEVYAAVSISPSQLRAMSLDMDGLSVWCKERQFKDIANDVEAVGGHVAPVQPLKDAARSGYFSDSETRLQTVHPVTGPEEIVASPWRVDGGRAPYRKPAPVLGEGTYYVLGSILGIGDERIAELQAAGVV